MTYNKGVPLSRVDLNLVDEQWLGILRISFYDCHIVSVDGEVERRLACQGYKAESVAGFIRAL